MAGDTKKIIVVADNPGQGSEQPALAGELAKAGLKRSVKASGAIAAWKLLKSGTVGLLFARDQVLADKSFALVKKINQTPELASLPIVAVVGEPDNLRPKLARLGVTTFLLPPYTPETLKQAVDRAKQRATKPRKGMFEEPPADAAAPSDKPPQTLEAAHDLQQAGQLLASGDHSGAARAYTALIKSDQISAEAFFGLARALNGLGQKDKAQKAMARGRKLKKSVQPSDYSDLNARTLEEMAREGDDDTSRPGEARGAAETARKAPDKAPAAERKKAPAAGKPADGPKEAQPGKTEPAPQPRPGEGKQKPAPAQDPKKRPQAQAPAQASPQPEAPPERPVVKPSKADADDPFALAGMVMSPELQDPGPSSGSKSGPSPGSPPEDMDETMVIDSGELVREAESALDDDPMMKAYAETHDAGSSKRKPPSPPPDRGDEDGEDDEGIEPKRSSPPAKERRMMPRIPLAGFTIHVHKPKGDYPIIDASMTGISFTSDNGFSPGDTIVIDIEDMERVRVRKIKCVVVHITEDRVGCRFKSLSRRQTKELEELLLSVQEVDEDDFPIDLDSNLDLDIGMM